MATNSNLQMSRAGKTDEFACLGGAEIISQ